MERTMAHRSHEKRSAFLPWPRYLALSRSPETAIASRHDGKASGHVQSRRNARGPRGLAGAGIFILGLLASQPEAHAQQAVMSQGDLVVTGFSGLVAVPPPPGRDPADGTFTDPAGRRIRVPA